MINYNASQPGAARAVGLGAQTGNASADTRFQNARINAKNSNLSSAAKAPAINNGPSRPSIKQFVPPSQGPSGYSQGVQAQPSPVSQLAGGDQVSAEAPPMVHPDDLALEYFMSAPEVQEALSREKLKQYFKRNNPLGAEATVARDVVRSVVSRMA